MRAALITLAAACALLAGATSAGASSTTGFSRVPILGAVPHGGSRSLARAATPRAACIDPSSCGSYETAVNKYFTDVAAASGTTSNVYSVDTQYYDGTGSIAYQSTFGGSYVDTDPFPASGCTVATVCLTDAQLQVEIATVLAREGWQPGVAHMFFLMTPSGVASCSDGTNCSTNVFCAYHSAFGTFAAPVIYANEPYDATINGCNGSPSPNNDDADATINTISHEHNEAITDPFGNAWFSDSGGPSGEIGDLCAWTFGSPQVINGDSYALQDEYSNADHGCVQTLGGPTQTPPSGDGTGPLAFHAGGTVMRTNTVYTIYWVPNGSPGNLAPPVVSGTAAFGQSLSTSTGTWSEAPTSFTYQWQRCDATGSNCADIFGATGSSYNLTSVDVAHTVRSEVSAVNVAGAAALVPSVASEVVVPALATAALPIVSGVAAVGHTLSATEGTWNTPATSFAYQWLRCSAGGTGCTSIGGATAGTYKVASADVGHALEAQITAVNGAGPTAAVSSPTAVVVAKPALRQPPHISGQAKQGRSLRAIAGVWSGSPTAFAYQWLRCSGSGSQCATIHGATKSTYSPSTHDVGHRLRVRVTASGPAGKTAATSFPTARVKR